MNRKFCLVALVGIYLLLPTGNSLAAIPLGQFGPITLSATREPTIELPGHSTWTLTADSDLEIRAFDFTGDRDSPFDDPAARGFFGSIVQQNPNNSLTIFAGDFNAIFDGERLRKKDSHFLFSPSSLVILPEFASESVTQLRAVFASPNPLPNPIEFVQLVIPNDVLGAVEFRGSIAAGPISNLQEIMVFGVIPSIPEPATIALLGLPMVGLAGLARRRS